MCYHPSTGQDLAISCVLINHVSRSLHTAETDVCAYYHQLTY